MLISEYQEEKSH